MSLENLHLAGYVLPDENVMLYHYIESFPPGSGTVAMGDMVGQRIAQMIEGHGEKSRARINILELGIGPGTFFLSLFPHIFDKNILLKGIDIDPVSVSLAKYNVDRFRQKYRAERVSSDIQVADWSKDETFLDIERFSYQFVIFNPPYYGPEHTIPPKLRHTRTKAIISPDPEGLYHYLKVFPHIPAVLNPQKGSSFIARLPGDEFIENTKFGGLVTETAGKIEAPVSVSTQRHQTQKDIKSYLILEVG